jgi:hypothetical protein
VHPSPGQPPTRHPRHLRQGPLPLSRLRRRQHRRQPHRDATRQRIYGRWHPFVDAGPVREHIAALRAAGIGVERIAQLAGLSVGHVRQLADHGHGDLQTTQRVRPSTATRVLSLGIDDASRAPHSRVNATGTRRRLRALMALGWPTGVYQRSWTRPLN